MLHRQDPCRFAACEHIAEQLPFRDLWELLVRYIVDRILPSVQAIRRNKPSLPATAVC